MSATARRALHEAPLQPSALAPFMWHIPLAAQVWADDAPRGADARLAAMKALVHVADLSNAARPPRLAGMWTRAVYDEFYKQGDAERELGLDMSPLCDRAAVAIAESQVRSSSCAWLCCDAWPA